MHPAPTPPAPPTDPDEEAPEEAEGDDEPTSDGPEPLFRPEVALGLAALSGALYASTMPWPGFWPAAFVAQAPLYLALLRQPPGRAAAIGLIAGFSYSAIGFYWLFTTMKVFGGIPALPALGLAAVLWLYQSGRVALTGWLVGRAGARGWPVPLVFVLATATGELVYPLLFPWYYAFTVVHVPWFHQIGEIGGVLLVGALLQGSSLALAELARARLEGDRPSRRLLIAGLGATLLSGAYGLVRIPQVEAAQRAAPTLRVGVAQGNLPLVGRSDGVRVHRKLTKELREQGAELVVWSEGSVPDVFDEDTYEDDTLRVISRGLGVPTLIGGGVREPRTEGGGRPREYNTALLTGADGAVIGRYDKQKLLPFGEYMPFGQTFPWLYEQSPHSGHLSPGTSFTPMVFDGHPIAVLICYEDILPAFVNRAVAQSHPELLVNMTIDTWFGDTAAPFHHLGLAQLRAVEHRRFLVRATNSGVSAIVDAAGRVQQRGGTFTREGFVGDVRRMTKATVYEAVGDVPFWIGAALTFAMAFVRRPRRA